MRPGAAPDSVGEAGVAVAEVRGGADVVVSVTASSSRHAPSSQVSNAAGYSPVELQATSNLTLCWGPGLHLLIPYACLPNLKTNLGLIFQVY